MRDVLLIIVTFAAFAFGFYIVKQVDNFIMENQRQITDESRNSSALVRIAAETPQLLQAVSSALEQCSDSYPYMNFFLSSGRVNQLLHKLSEGSIDIILLTEENAKYLNEDLISLRLPYQNRNKITMLGLKIENLDEDRWIYVAWDRRIKSKDRDRVIFTLENKPSYSH